MAADTDSSSSNANDTNSAEQTYWHAAYKVSDIPSPREELDLKFEDAKPLTEIKRLSLLNGNMTAEEESLLRSILMDRVINSFCEGKFESTVESLGIKELIESTPTQLYCKAVYCKESKELDYIICFISATKSGLELFQNDLNKSASRLTYHLNKYVETGNTDEYLKEVESWWVNNVHFVKECLHTFDYDLATLICAGFCGDTVIFSEEVPTDIKKNVERQLKVNQNLGPIQMRQMVENFKLKSIQDMNTFRRLLTQAEVDYYACFRTYLFLVTSGNGLVLMRNSRLQNSMENTLKRHAVLDTLERFIEKREGFGKFDTKELKEQLTNKMGQLRFN